MRQQDAAAAEWLRHAEALTVALPGTGRGPAAEHPRRLVEELVGLALAMDCTGRPHARCGLAEQAEAERLCALAADIRRRSPSPSPPAASGGDLGRRFVAALEGAAGAVYLCRRVAHPSGSCWFSVAIDDDLCGQVLALTHTAAA